MGHRQQLFVIDALGTGRGFHPYVEGLSRAWLEVWALLLLCSIKPRSSELQTLKSESPGGVCSLPTGTLECYSSFWLETCFSDSSVSCQGFNTMIWANDTLLWTQKKLLCEEWKTQTLVFLSSFSPRPTELFHSRCLDVSVEVSTCQRAGFTTPPRPGTTSDTCNAATSSIKHVLSLLGHDKYLPGLWLCGGDCWFWEVRNRRFEIKGVFRHVSRSAAWNIWSI